MTAQEIKGRYLNLLIIYKSIHPGKKIILYHYLKRLTYIRIHRQNGCPMKKARAPRKELTLAAPRVAPPLPVGFIQVNKILNSGWTDTPGASKCLPSVSSFSLLHYSSGRSIGNCQKLIKCIWFFPGKRMTSIQNLITKNSKNLIHVWNRLIFSCFNVLFAAA